MIDLLGKRPFIGRSDDMDKYLDEQSQRGLGQSSAPPPLQGLPEPSVTSQAVQPDKTSP